MEKFQEPRHEYGLIEEGLIAALKALRAVTSDEKVRPDVAEIMKEKQRRMKRKKGAGLWIFPGSLGMVEMLESSDEGSGQRASERRVLVIYESSVVMVKCVN